MPRWPVRVTSAQSEKPGCVVFGGLGLTPGSVRSSSKKRVDDGEWHFVMGMHDEEEGKLRVYLDGKISKAANSKGTFRHCPGYLSALYTFCMSFVCSGQSKICRP